MFERSAIKGDPGWRINNFEITEIPPSVSLRSGGGDTGCVRRRWRNYFRVSRGYAIDVRGIRVKYRFEDIRAFDRALERPLKSINFLLVARDRRGGVNSTRLLLPIKANSVPFNRLVVHSLLPRVSDIEFHLPLVIYFCRPFGNLPFAILIYTRACTRVLF